MVKLKIQNFGPIKSGFSQNNGFMEIMPVTVVIGNQATGKSTVAKLYSLFLWLEKAFVKGVYSESVFRKADFLFLLANHKIDSYLKDDTVIEYVGEMYSFGYKNKRIVKPKCNGYLSSYHRAKIMYIPAERNILSVLSISDFEELNSVSDILRIFHQRYETALRTSDNTDFKLPVSDAVLHYNKQTGNISVSSENSSIPIEQSSSGIQSVAPLSVVSNYLSDLVQLDIMRKLKDLKIKEQKLLKSDLKKISESDSFKDSVDSTFDNLLVSGKDNVDEKLKIIPYIETSLQYFFNTCFANIVEEPELSLFPSSQNEVLYELLKCKNKNKNNTLFITTHSPYFVSELSLCIKAYDLAEKGILVKELNKILPESSYISGKECVFYETHSDGSITRLKTYGAGMPSDDNYLNNYLEDSNKKFDRLLDLQEKNYD